MYHMMDICMFAFHIFAPVWGNVLRNRRPLWRNSFLILSATSLSKCTTDTTSDSLLFPALCKLTRVATTSYLQGVSLASCETLFIWLLGDHAANSFVSHPALWLDVGCLNNKISLSNQPLLRSSKFDKVLLEFFNFSTSLHWFSLKLFLGMIWNTWASTAENLFVGTFSLYQIWKSVHFDTFIALQKWNNRWTGKNA